MKVISKHKISWGFTALAFVVLAGCTEPVFKPHCYVVPQTAPVLDNGKMAGHAPEPRQIVMCLKPQMVPAEISHTGSNGVNPGPRPGPVEPPVEGSASLPREGALAVYGEEFSDTTNGAQAFDPNVGLLTVNAKNLRDRLEALRNGEPE